MVTSEMTRLRGKGILPLERSPEKVYRAPHVRGEAECLFW
jgi:hypothetical protein